MGRSLGNTMVNLGMEGECDEALYQVLKPCNLNTTNSVTYLEYAHIVGLISESLTKTCYCGSKRTFGSNLRT